MVENKLNLHPMEKMFWGASDIGKYIGVSTCTAYRYFEKIKNTYDIDFSRCVRGKIPKEFVLDFFHQEIKKKEQ